MKGSFLVHSGLRPVLECFVYSLFFREGLKVSPTGIVSLPPLSDITLYSAYQQLEVEVQEDSITSIAHKAVLAHSNWHQLQLYILGEWFYRLCMVRCRLAGFWPKTRVRLATRWFLGISVKAALKSTLILFHGYHCLIQGCKGATGISCLTSWQIWQHTSPLDELISVGLFLALGFILSMPDCIFVCSFWTTFSLIWWCSTNLTPLNTYCPLISIYSLNFSSVYLFCVSKPWPTAAAIAAGVAMVCSYILMQHLESSILICNA